MGKQAILNTGGLAIVSTPSMKYMAEKAYQELRGLIKKKSIDFCLIDYKRFPGSETMPTIKRNVRGKDAYLFYDFNGDAAHDAFVLLLTLSALQDSGADSITIVAPFIPFLRQDRKDQPRVPISAKVMIESMTGFDAVKHVITLDMHSEQMVAAFPRAPDHLPGHVIFEPWINKQFGDQLENVVIVGPDFGSEKRVDRLAEGLGCERAYLTKKRGGTGVKMREIHGAPVKGQICVINDDILDTCGTMSKAAEALKSAGAKEVYLTGTHAVFGGDAYQTLANTGCQVVVTDSLLTIPHDWLTVLPLARYLAHTILQNIIADGSVSRIINDGLPS